MADLANQRLTSTFMLLITVIITGLYTLRPGRKLGWEIEQHLCRTGTHIAVARSASAPRQVQFAPRLSILWRKDRCVLHLAALDDGNCDRLG